MTSLRWEQTPELDHPIVVAAFAGWNDAGDAASTAVSYLKRRWGQGRIADIDPEPFYDFSALRPLIRLDRDRARRLQWPENVLYRAGVDDGPDLILIEGVEPHLRWRAFSESVLAVAERYDIKMMVTLGALLAEVHHARPVSVVGTSTDEALSSESGFQPSTYEGPTGIVGVLQDAARQAGVPAASLWAAVPTYVPNATSPKAALALIERLVDLVGVPMAATDLQIASAEYERQVERLLEEDESASEYARMIEESLPEDDEDEDELAEVDPEQSDVLIQQVEDFLREQGGRGTS